MSQSNRVGKGEDLLVQSEGACAFTKWVTTFTKLLSTTFKKNVTDPNLAESSESVLSLLMFRIHTKECVYLCV